ncbi:IS1634 family transposase [Emticicia fluvialis]|uniref:IS1634 family transposase n=1 Tax=Emticicia fluvialis TaxID=2974474 RepID=UPI002165C923|nr:IS1634 family transposase [Emticicia fluvialis]
MAYLKVERKQSGTYLRILESFRNGSGKPSSRVLYSLGKVEDYKPEELRNIGIRFYELGGGELKTILEGDLIELGRYNYGYQKVFGYALEQYGLRLLLDRLQQKSKLQFSLFDSVFLMLLERLQSPCSKRSNFQHRDEYINLPELSLQHLYRALDKLAQYTELIQQQIFQTGRNLFNQSLDVVFYDVTTFYFASEVEKEGQLRQMGFGKDGKIGKTQVLFCMLIDHLKNPIGYRVFKGNTYEGDTFREALGDLKKRYQIDKVIVVADRGMLSKKNLEITNSKGYEFIIGERLKSLPQKTQQTLLDLKNYHQQWIYKDATGQDVLIRYTTLKQEGKTFITTYSAKRAAKDKQDREDKLQHAQHLLKNPSKINNKATRFFLKSNENQKYSLNEEKIKVSEKYDGFLAISTNNQSMAVAEVLDQYKQLFKIEHSFRTFKSHLETRPMFHWTDQRIEGHICLCYIAFAIQNFVLQKINRDKNVITEKGLRDTLDKMQVSLIENNGAKSYLRSMPTENEKIILQKLGLKPILPIQTQAKFKI